jgi:hypothetical protein
MLKDRFILVNITKKLLARFKEVVIKLEKLSDKLLIEAYKSAQEQELDEAFIQILLDEIKVRNIDGLLLATKYQ